MSWQKWDDPRFIAFLKEFYGEQLLLATEIVRPGYGSGYEAITAVFNKIAPPAVYLKEEYEEWLTEIEESPKVYVNKQYEAIPITEEKPKVESKVEPTETLVEKEPTFHRFDDSDVLWTIYKRIRKDDQDRSARPGEDGWCYTNNLNTLELVELITRGGGVALVEMRGHKYRCERSGEGGIFINRQAWKGQEK